MGGVAILVAAVPLLLLLVLANAAEKQRLAGKPDQVLVWLTWGGLTALWLAVAAGGGLLLVAGSVAGTALADLDRVTGLPGELAGPEILTRSGAIALVTAALGVVVLLPPVRGLAARLMPMDQRSVIDATALSLVFLGILNIALTLAIGLDSVAAALEVQAATGGLDLASALAALLAQGVVFVALAVAGVGFPVRRGWTETLDRLAIRWPGRRDWVAGLAGWGVLLLAAGVIAGGAQLAGLGPDASVERLTEALLGPLTASLVGILAIGLVSGISEEALFRGALQPRLGLLGTAIVFTLLHANYGFTLSAVVVLALGLILGVLRQRSSTTAAMLAHGLYNTSLLLAAYLAARVLPGLPGQ